MNSVCGTSWAGAGMFPDDRAYGNQDRGERAVLIPCPVCAVPEGSAVTAHPSTRKSVG